MGVHVQGADLPVAARHHGAGGGDDREAQSFDNPINKNLRENPEQESGLQVLQKL